MRGRRYPLILAAVLALVAFVPPAVPTESYAVTAKTARFVAFFEGFYPCVYADPVGHATIGYGHLLHLGAPTKRDRKKWGCLTRRQGLKLLRRDLRRFEKQVRIRIRGARVNAPIITALTSFAFNLGAGALDRQRHRGSKKTTNIAANIRKGHYRKAGRQMLLYNGAYIDGRRIVLPGLVTRRKKEYRLLLRGANRLSRECRSNCGSGNPGGIGNPGGLGNPGNGNGGLTAN